MGIEEVSYLAARAAEERHLAKSLPEGPAAIIHRELAELYEEAIRDERQRHV